MPITSTIKGVVSNGNRIETLLSLAFATGYPTGGEPFTARMAGLSVIDHLELPPQGGYEFEYDYINAKIKVYYPQGGASSGTNDGTGGVTTGGATASAVNATTPAVNSGTARECQNAKDLSALTAVRGRALGV